jgi:hypothetical protein
MVLERDKHAWRHTSSLMALLANCHSSKTKFSPSDFDPYHAPVALEKIRLRDLASMWGLKPNVRSNQSRSRVR